VSKKVVKNRTSGQVTVGEVSVRVEGEEAQIKMMKKTNYLVV